jgi:hypothetical protein
MVIGAYMELPLYEKKMVLVLILAGYICDGKSTQVPNNTRLLIAPEARILVLCRPCRRHTASCKCEDNTGLLHTGLGIVISSQALSFK